MKIDSNLIEGQFIKRLNRFAAAVTVNGRSSLAHVPNSGRLHELFSVGVPVLLSPKAEEGRKTPYDLIMVRLGKKLISCDARLPNYLVAEALESRSVKEIRGFSTIRREVFFMGSRFDFCLTGGEIPWLLEVKSVTLVTNGVALFPDAPTIRGTEHVAKLGHALKRGYRAAVIFVVQRDDARYFSPNDAQDPAFGRALRDAASLGVRVFAYDCRVSCSEVVIRASLPVSLRPT